MSSTIAPQGTDDDARPHAFPEGCNMYISLKAGKGLMVMVGHKCPHDIFLLSHNAPVPFLLQGQPKKQHPMLSNGLHAWCTFKNTQPWDWCPMTMSRPWSQFHLLCTGHMATIGTMSHSNRWALRKVLSTYMGGPCSTLQSDRL